MQFSLGIVFAGLGRCQHETDQANNIWQFSKIEGPQYKPQYFIILTIPKKLQLLLGNPPYQNEDYLYRPGMQ